MEEGKAAIPGHLYLELMEELMRRNDLFISVFSVCSWCLMCRVSNVADLRGAHLSWIGDSLLLSIVRHKADKEGERTDAKHCYANPFNPSACVITAIAAFFSVFGVPKNAHDAVFEGDRQHDRFVESLRRVLNACPMLKAKFQQLGITEEDIAAHSFRKGARSYAQGGTTSGPSTPSVHLRGGWALEGWNFVLLFFFVCFLLYTGMDKKYVRYEAAADQFIGRILSMLNVNSPDFAVLAPHFDCIDSDVLQAVTCCFPNAAPNLNAVLVHCLASLIFHQDYFSSARS
jgi:hypothetical protein